MVSTFQIEEEKRSTKSMLQIHKEWRNIMRRAKVEEQRRDIDWLSKKHVHQVGLHALPFTQSSNFKTYHSCRKLYGVGFSL